MIAFFRFMNWKYDGILVTSLKENEAAREFKDVELGTDTGIILAVGEKNKLEIYDLILDKMGSSYIKNNVLYICEL